MRLTLAITLAPFLLSLFAFGQETTGQTPDGERFASLVTRAQAGDREAERQLASAYEEGVGVQPNASKAAEWYRKAAEQGDAAAQNNLGVLYRVGSGVPKDLNLAIRWYQKSAAQEFPAGLFNLGISYYNGDGLPIDPASAFAWLELASEAGSDPAKAALSRIGAEIPECDKVLAFARIATGYEEGVVLPKNLEKAAHWFKVAAEAGDPYAQMKLSTRYLAGEGVPKDTEQAAFWREQAFKQKYTPAIYQSAEMYEKGEIVPKDVPKAAKMYEQAVEYGDIPALISLARLYANGDGVKRDDVKAYALVRVAAMNRSVSVDEQLATLSRKLNPRQVKAAEHQAAEISRKRQFPPLRKCVQSEHRHQKN
jgi:uncharacterized protein